MKFDVIVAGAGIWGCTAARVLADAGRKVLVLERRSVPGGNVRCETDPENRIEIHTYGSHIFHTGIDEVWDFIRRFAEFNGYQHKVLAKHAGKTYFMPLGLALVNQFYGTELTPSELPAFIARESAKGFSGDVPSNFEEQAISFIGKPLYDAFIRGYTAKQWGTDPKNLPASVIKRLPVRVSYDINYFPDYRQGIPLAGYNSVFERMLDHPGITLECGVDWTEWRKANPEADRDRIPVLYSGPVDELFGYKFGPLPWRSLSFERELLQIADFQGASVINYTDADVPYTRIHEFKHYHPENTALMASPITAICREYPKEWKLGDEPYYPVDTPDSRELLSRYQAEAALTPHITVGGRLGAYKYFDMDKSMADAIKTAKTLLR